mgnify:CR=1 FL=1
MISSGEKRDPSDLVIVALKHQNLPDALYDLKNVVVVLLHLIYEIAVHILRSNHLYQFYHSIQILDRG